MLPKMLAFDSSADEHAVALLSFLFGSLGIRCISNSMELPLLMQDGFDDMDRPIYDACSEEKTMYPCPFQWKATPLLEIDGASVEQLHQFHAAASAFSRSKTWDRCRVKLGVLVPGSRWRLAVPLGWSDKSSHGGFAVDEYMSPTSPQPMSLSTMPGFMMLTEDNVPFADVDATETHGFQVDNGMYPVPVFIDGDTFTPSLRRPSGPDLKWMTAVLPAVAAFIDKHKMTKTQTAAVLHERMAPSGTQQLTHVESASGILVCWPPPSPEWMPDRPGNLPIPVAESVPWE